MRDEKKCCTVRDGRFVEPCDTLSQATDGYGNIGKARGIVSWEYINTNTGKMARKFFSIRTRHFSQGIVFNSCLFCGEKINGPVLEPEAPKDSPP